jgi:hypothetical protein
LKLLPGFGVVPPVTAFVGCIPNQVAIGFYRADADFLMDNGIDGDLLKSNSLPESGTK